jgi:hypothetical protein
MGSHDAHRGGERAHRVHDVVALELACDLLAIDDGFDVGERRVEERREVVLLPSVRDRADHAIEMQVAKARGRLGRLV